MCVSRVTVSLNGKNYESVQTFMNNFCKLTCYGLQVKKCLDESCLFCSWYDLFVPEVKFLPGPML